MVVNGVKYVSVNDTECYNNGQIIHTLLHIPHNNLDETWTGDLSVICMLGLSVFIAFLIIITLAWLSHTDHSFSLTFSYWSLQLDFLILITSAWLSLIDHFSLTSSLWSLQLDFLLLITSAWLSHIDHLSLTHSYWSPQLDFLILITSAWLSPIDHLSLTHSYWSLQIDFLTLVTFSLMWSIFITFATLLSHTVNFLQLCFLTLISFVWLSRIDHFSLTFLQCGVRSRAVFLGHTWDLYELQ